jgi:restriction system protein
MKPACGDAEKDTMRIMATKADLPPLADYLPPLVAALKARGGSATIEELEEEVARLMNLTDEQRAVEHGRGNRTYFEYRLAWARSYLKKAGVIDNSERGVWQLTPDARREATRDGAPAIDLVDGEALADLLKQYGLGIDVKMVEAVTVKPEFFDSI